MEAYNFSFLLSAASALVVFMSSGSQSHLTSRAFQVHKSLIAIINYNIDEELDSCCNFLDMFLYVSFYITICKNGFKSECMS